MADLKLKDFVDENDLQKLVELDNTIERVRLIMLMRPKN